MALFDQRVVAVNHKASHLELWVVYYVDCLSLVRD